MKVNVTIRGKKQGPLTKIYHKFDNAVRVKMTIDNENGHGIAIVHASGFSYAFDLDRYDVVVEE